MAKRMAEEKEWREVYQNWDDSSITETRFYRVSKATYEWLKEHGNLCAVSICEWEEPDTIISVRAAYVEKDRWSGWDWIYNEFKASGLEPMDFIITGSNSERK